jgi:FtsP/CotA-like multicopper oxidase with cupredoxin domain
LGPHAGAFRSGVSAKQRFAVHDLSGILRKPPMLTVRALPIMERVSRGITRRGFMRRGAVGVAATAVGGVLVAQNRAEAHAVDVRLFVNEGFVALPGGEQLYHRGFGAAADDPGMPATVVRAIEGDRVTVSVTNTLDEPHGFAIDGLVDSGPIAPGATTMVRFDAPRAGTYLYVDPLGSPVNRVLGLHGAMVVSPAGASNVPFPGGPRFVREFVWVFTCIDTGWSESARRRQRIDVAAGFTPDVFLINGRFGDFSSKALDTTPHGRVGEATLVRMLNAGLTVKSIHFHGNHVHVLSRNGSPPSVVMNKDTVFVDRGEVVDVLLPFTMPPDAFPPTRVSDFPVHDHQEMTQTLHGGLYPNGLLTDWHLEG